MTTPAEFRESFEAQGIPAVVAFIEAGKRRPGGLDDGTLEAIRWLEERNRAAAEAASAKRDAREEETLSIARKASFEAERANLLASRANRWAMYAAIVAIVAAAIAAKDQILMLIFGS